MKIINEVRVMAADLATLEKIDNNGWDNNGRNSQWYTLSAAKLANGTILYKLKASNSGDCYGDYSTFYCIGGKNLLAHIKDMRGDYEAPREALAKLLGDIDESNTLIMDVLVDCGM